MKQEEISTKIGKNKKKYVENFGISMWKGCEQAVYKQN